MPAERTAPDHASGSGAGWLRKSLALVWVHPGLGQPGIALEDGGLVLGRDEACDVVLEDDQVSRRHTEVRRSGPIFVARDLGSRNGTYRT